MANVPVPENMPHGFNYGCDKVRFLAPVHSGKWVRVHGDILDDRWKEENHCVFKGGMTVEIEGEEKPALYAEWINYVYGKSVQKQACLGLEGCTTKVV